MRARYGTTSTRAALRRDIEAGAAEMLRISRVGFIAKLTDSPNGGAFLPLSLWVCKVLGSLGLAPCYSMHTYSTPTPRPPGETAVLPRSSGATWLVFRRDGQGQDGAARYPDFDALYRRQQASHFAALRAARRCAMCDTPIAERRRDAATCSDACRQRAHRRRAS
jgi:hypothetical protein